MDSEKTMKLPSNIVIYGTPKDKVLLRLRLLKMADLVVLCDMMRFKQERG